MNRKTITGTIAMAFIAGAALPALVIWNPLHWQWAEHLLGRIHAHDAIAAVSPDGKRLWTCGMHPQVVQDKPGTCPICGMNLVPVAETAAAPSIEMEGMEHGATESPLRGIRVSQSFLQSFAVRTAQVEQGSIPLELRTVGTLAYNQKNIVGVNTKYEGWIEKAAANYVGETVSRGGILFEIYSPQLVLTQQEYLAALDYLEKLSEGGTPEAVARARSLVDSAKQRLRYWDITEAQIDALEQTRKATRTLKVVSPVSGVIIEKMSDSLAGMRVMPGMNAFKIANLSTIWANIEVYEYQIQHVRMGQAARITIDAFPGRQWAGRIIYMDPAVNRQTRTLRASVEISNPGWTLRPDMFANVEIRMPSPSGVVRVPEEAVLRSGQRNVVIVQRGEGLFEPREVELGSQGAGFLEVRSGLRAGEIVVTSSQFLIDSESKLKEAIGKILSREPSAGEPVHIH